MVDANSGAIYVIGGGLGSGYVIIGNGCPYLHDVWVSTDGGA